MMQDDVMKSVRAKIVSVVCLGAIGLIGAGFNSGATASGTATSITIVIAPVSNAFCYPAIKLVGLYSVNVERAMGMNDNRPLPNHMTPGIRTAVKALAASALALSRKAPTAHMVSELRLLSVKLRESPRPIDVVRAEAAFGATGYRQMGLMCHSATMLMTPTNPLGGFQSGMTRVNTG